MPRCLLAAALAGLVLAAPARAQLTFTQADAAAQVTRSGTGSAYAATSAAGLQALADATGPNRTWDFSGLAYEHVATSTITPVSAPVPGSDDPALARATHISRVAQGDTATYIYQGLSADTLQLYGFASLVDVGGGPQLSLLRFLPSDVTFPLPLTATSAWGEVYEISFEPSIPGFVNRQAAQSAVVGWGTLVTPAGQAAALMVRSEVITTTFLNGTEIGRDTSGTVEFVTRGALGAAITLDGAGVAEDATYAEAAAGPVLEPVAPNPVRAGRAVTLAFALPEAATARLEVFDALGRRVAVLAGGAFGAGRHTAAWSTDGLPAGLYVARLTADGRTDTRRGTLAD